MRDHRIGGYRQQVDQPISYLQRGAVGVLIVEIGAVNQPGFQATVSMDQAQVVVALDGACIKRERVKVSQEQDQRINDGNAVGSALTKLFSGGPAG